MMLLSGDPPRSRALSILLVVIIAALAVAPFVFPGAKFAPLGNVTYRPSPVIEGAPRTPLP